MKPALSVVLVTDRYETIRLVLACLNVQSVRESIEVVIVIPSDHAAEIPAADQLSFHSLNVVEVESIRPMPPARAAGVRASKAGIIFIGETHSFPHPQFAAEIIAAHNGPWDIVVPGLENANPESPKSWSAFVLDYGYWMSGLSAAVIANGPTWNASYKRELLLSLGDRLDTVLSSGDDLPMELRSRRHTVYFQPRARIDHSNVEVGGWADERFLSGRVVGANRSRRWSWMKRGFYLTASPLIPVVLLYRTTPSIRVLIREGSMPSGSIAAIIAGLFIRTLGEAAGYIAGISPEEEQRMENYELHKLKSVRRVRGAAEAFA